MGTSTAYSQPPELKLPPQYRWLQDVYALDISTRIDLVKAEITSVHGQYLKLDSTKKVCDRYCIKVVALIPNGWKYVIN